MADRQLIAYALLILLIAAIPAFWWWMRRRLRVQSEHEDRHLRIDLNAGGRSSTDSPDQQDRAD